MRPCWWRPLWATLGTYGRRLLFAVLVGAVDDYRLVACRATECSRAMTRFGRQTLPVLLTTALIVTLLMQVSDHALWRGRALQRRPDLRCTQLALRPYALPRDNRFEVMALSLLLWSYLCSVVAGLHTSEVARFITLVSAIGTVVVIAVGLWPLVAGNILWGSPDGVVDSSSTASEAPDEDLLSAPPHDDVSSTAGSRYMELASVEPRAHSGSTFFGAEQEESAGFR